MEPNGHYYLKRYTFFFNSVLQGGEMAKDIKIDIDGIRLNVRVGMIMRYKKDVVIEISTIGRNSVVPGGRIHINEKSSNALVREIKEEMNFDIDERKLRLIKVFENFFCFDKKDVHEIYFLYEYILSDEEFSNLTLEGNKDNDSTYFALVSSNDLEKYNLLPTELHDIIKNSRL